MSSNNSLQSLLASYRSYIDDAIESYLSAQLPPGPLCEACTYALGNGAKRLRPALVLMVSEALGSGADVTYPALAVEFFHTASLIADDLPSMDNDAFRRGVPTLHRVYGEGTALLASYALIAEGYSCLARGVHSLKESRLPHSVRSARIALLAVEAASRCMGITGAVGGQYLDISLENPTAPLLEEVAIKKTVSLFEVALVLGWLFGGGEEEKLPQIKEAAQHLGLAFQIADDLADYLHDRLQGRQSNLARGLGPNDSVARLHKTLTSLEHSLHDLGLYTPPLQALVAGLRLHSDMQRPTPVQL